MISVIDTKLKYNNSQEIKAFKGSRTNDLLRLDSLESTMYVGDLQFPVVSLNKLSFDPDGTMQINNNYLTVTYGNILYTPEILTITVEKATKSDQVVTFVVQHGQTSRVMTNYVDQTAHILFDKNEPLTVAATNNLTGATKSQTVNVVAGQHYKLQVESTTVNSGELLNICVEETWDLENVPIVPFGKNKDYLAGHFLIRQTVYQLASQEFVYAGKTPEEALAEARDRYGTTFVMEVYNNPRQSPWDFGSMETWMSPYYKLEYGYPDLEVYTPVGIDVSGARRPDITPGSFIHTGDVFTVPMVNGPDNTDEELFSLSKPYILSSGVTFIDRPFLDTLDESRPPRKVEEDFTTSEFVFHLIPGQSYQLVATSTYEDRYRDTVNELYTGGYGGTWVYTLYVDRYYKIEARVLGPLNKVCSRTQAIDTRKTEHFVSLELAPLN